MNLYYQETVLLLVEKAADDLVSIIRAAEGQNDTKLAEDAMFLYGKVLDLRPTVKTKKETHAR